MSIEPNEENAYCKGWWDAMEACRNNGIPTAKNKSIPCEHDWEMNYKSTGTMSFSTWFICKKCKVDTRDFLKSTKLNKEDESNEASTRG